MGMTYVVVLEFVCLCVWVRGFGGVGGVVCGFGWGVDLWR